MSAAARLSSTTALLPSPLLPKRRKAQRPSEILEAAKDVFAEKGFVGARLDEVARRAGVAKGTLYRYFETKEDLFRAVGRSAISSHLDALAALETAPAEPIAILLPRLLTQASGHGVDVRVMAIARAVIGESHKFPDLARVWHDEVAVKLISLVSMVIAHAQARGEVRPGDPRLYAFSIVGPVTMALLFREVFGSIGAEVPDVDALADQHISVLLQGLAAQP